MNDDILLLGIMATLALAASLASVLLTLMNHGECRECRRRRRRIEELKAKFDELSKTWPRYPMPPADAIQEKGG
jgi:hypothetical protein